MPLADYYPQLKGWTPVEKDPTVAKTPGIPAESLQVSPFLRAALPMPMQYQPDTLKQYNRPGISSFRFSPVSPAALPANNSAAQNISTIVVNKAIAALPPAATPAPAVGDGLVHGDAVWEYDSAYTIWRDDFEYGSNVFPVGELGWNLLSPVGSATSGYTNIAGFPTAGWFCFYPSAVVNGSTNIVPVTSPIMGDWRNEMFALLDYPGWKLTWVFAWRRSDPNSFSFSMVKNSTYLGLFQSWPNNCATRPPIFFGARFDTDAASPSINDSTIVLEAVINQMPNANTTRVNTQGQTFNTGIVPTEGTIYRLEISCVATGQIKITLNGVGTTFSVPAVTYTPVSASPSIQNGMIQISSNTPANEMPFGVGSNVLITGYTGSAAVLNTLVTVSEVNTTQFYFYNTMGYVSGGTGTPSFTGYPVLHPIAFQGNDSTASPPSAGSRMLCVDFYSLVWNKGLAGASNPASSKPRYW